jgi:hypothetical protein
MEVYHFLTAGTLMKTIYILRDQTANVANDL